MEGLSANVTHLVKFSLIGDSGVGKTCIMKRFMNNVFDKDEKPSIGGEFFTRHFTASRGFKVQFWDLPGAEKHRNNRQTYLLNTCIFFLVYDINNRESFNHLPQWLEELRWQDDDFSTEFKPGAIVCLVGNKLDLNHLRKVTEEEAEEFARLHGLHYFEMSAKNNTHVKETFDAIMLAFDQADATDRKQNGNGLTQILEYSSMQSEEEEEEEPGDSIVWIEYESRVAKLCCHRRCIVS